MRFTRQPLVNGGWSWDFGASGVWDSGFEPYGRVVWGVGLTGFGFGVPGCEAVELGDCVCLRSDGAYVPGSLRSCIVTCT